MWRSILSLSIAVALCAGTNVLAATTYNVGTLEDTTGTCEGSSCSTLRAAIMAAIGSAGNTISLTGLSGTITLTSALPNITQSVTITGPGSNTLTISGNNAYQVFYIQSGTVAISGLTLVNGYTKSLYGGGAILNYNGTLTVTNSTFSGNSAAGVNSVGGAIYNNKALTVTNSTFFENSAPDGGGIVSNGTLTVTNSTFYGNSAGFYGGAILDIYGALTVSNSNFSGNSAADRGGAIFLESTGTTLVADNNIFAGNTASSAGGASIDNYGGNTANAAYNLFYQNLDAGQTEDDCNKCTSNTNAISGSNPNLLPLGFYGGPTKTMLPRFGSPAICAGLYADVPNGVTTDQRGFPLTNSKCSNGGVDVGPVQSDYFEVTNTADSGAGSLRAAITAANATGWGGDIDFAANVTGTITLSNALSINAQFMNVLGPGAGNLTLSGNNASQILNISSGAVTIRGLTFANGNSATDAGAIDNFGTLTVTSSVFKGNFANDGGAIYSLGTLTVSDSTFSGNSGSYGGGIENLGTLMVDNCTFSGNSVTLSGGAIMNDSGALTVTNSTFSGNSAALYGGAIYNYLSSLVTANNNIFIGNRANPNGGAGILNGSTANASYNLFYQNLDTGGTEDDCLNCTSNTNAITSTNPLLAALGNYGGPTQTMLPQPGSPAICAASNALTPSGVTTDQRGFSRTTTYNSTTCQDLGAVQTDYTAVAFSSSGYSSVSNQAVNPAPVVTVTENGQNIGGVPIALSFSGTGSPTGLGPVTTVGGTGASFSSLSASAAAQGTLSVSLPITASGNSVQPAALTASATLSVLSTTQTITFAVASPMTYGTAPITLTATGGASGNPVIFSLDPTSTPGAAALSGSTLTINSVGTIVIDANQAASAGFTAATQVQHSIVVNPAPMTITASSPTVTYGSAVPTITPIFGTFYNGDTSAVLTKQPTCVTAYTITSAVGSSPSTSCSAAAAANYAFSYVNGAVTVNSAPAFVITGSSPSLTITRGTTTGNTVPITITPANGFTGTVTLTCTITPAATSNPPTCSLSPSSVTLTGAGAQSTTLTISTTAAVAENQIKKLLWPSSGTVLAVVLMFGLPRRRGNWLVMLSVLALSIALGTIGCGGGSGSAGSSGNPGTTAGTYTVAVTGTSGSFTGTVGTVTLTVQ